MGDPKGLLIVPVGFNPDDDVRAFTVSAADYLNCVLSAGAAGGGMGDPKGKLATLLGFNPDGDLRALELDANDNLIISLLGGAAWEILRSDGTDAEWDTLADVIEAALLTGDGDILIRSGGAVTRLAAGAAGEILTMVGGVPAWGVAPAGGYTEGARVYRSAAKTLANNTDTVIDFNLERWDTDGIHDNAINNTRLTCQTAGKYYITGALKFKNDPDGNRGIKIKMNAANTPLASQFFPNTGTNSTYCSVGTVYDLAVDDYVTLWGYHLAGNNLDILVEADTSLEFAMQRIG